MYRIFSLTYQQTEILKEMHNQKEYSERMLKGDENLRKFRHDYRNHMIVINALLENGNTDRARNYINAMNSDISDTVNKISTGNFIADALLNNKAVVAAQAGNKIKFNGQFPSEGIADEDVCTILANALDNAIEAVTKLGEENTIFIESAVRNGNFILNITNPVLENVKIGKNNTLKTTKKNSNEHGIGTKKHSKSCKEIQWCFDAFL
ncbi:MAG: GHKL domain-containing protein [Clostridia bacterium]|nr:GHKL domain-containing protein [Clostridia bacterium]